MRQPYFNVATHGLLTAEVEVLSDTELTAHTILAELLLGLTRNYVGDETNQTIAETAVALQIKRQVALGVDVNTDVVQSWSEGGRTESYRDALSKRDPTALNLVGLLPGTSVTIADRMGYRGVMQSYRR